jgi:hypothetical protein
VNQGVDRRSFEGGGRVCCDLSDRGRPARAAVVLLAGLGVIRRGAGERGCSMCRRAAAADTRAQKHLARGEMARGGCECGRSLTVRRIDVAH